MLLPTSWTYFLLTISKNVEGGSPSRLVGSGLFFFTEILIPTKGTAFSVSTSVLCNEPYILKVRKSSP